MCWADGRRRARAEGDRSGFRGERRGGDVGCAISISRVLAQHRSFCLAASAIAAYRRCCRAFFFFTYACLAHTAIIMQRHRVVNINARRVLPPLQNGAGCSTHGGRGGVGSRIGTTASAAGRRTAYRGTPLRSAYLLYAHRFGIWTRSCAHNGANRFQRALARCATRARDLRRCGHHLGIARARAYVCHRVSKRTISLTRRTSRFGAMLRRCALSVCDISRGGMDMFGRILRAGARRACHVSGTARWVLRCGFAFRVPSPQHRSICGWRATLFAAGLRCAFAHSGCLLSVAASTSLALTWDAFAFAQFRAVSRAFCAPQLAASRTYIAFVMRAALRGAPCARMAHLLLYYHYLRRARSRRTAPSAYARCVCSRRASGRRGIVYLDIAGRYNGAVAS